MTSKSPSLTFAQLYQRARELDAESERVKAMQRRLMKLLAKQESHYWTTAGRMIRKLHTDPETGSITLKDGTVIPLKGYGKSRRDAIQGLRLWLQKREDLKDTEVVNEPTVAALNNTFRGGNRGLICVATKHTGRWRIFRFSDFVNLVVLYKDLLEIDRHRAYRWTSWYNLKLRDGATKGNFQYWASMIRGRQQAGLLPVHFSQDRK